MEKLKHVGQKCNPMARFVHIWPKVGLKQLSIFSSVVTLHNRFSLVENELATSNAFLTVMLVNKNTAHVSALSNVDLIW